MEPVPNAEPFGDAGIGARIERILCPVDFSQCSVRAYDFAQSIARHYRATLLVQHIVELWQHPCAFYSPSSKLLDFRQNLIAEGQKDLQQFVKTSGGIEPEYIVQEGLAAMPFYPWLKSGRSA
jgi:nucleotide-binding universal stress UspA family protein